MWPSENKTQQRMPQLNRKAQGCWGRSWGGLRQQLVVQATLLGQESGGMLRCLLLTDTRVPVVPSQSWHILRVVPFLTDVPALSPSVSPAGLCISMVG